jgi:hypothetical protein
MDGLRFDLHLDLSRTWEELLGELSHSKLKFGSTLVNQIVNRDLGKWTAEMRDYIQLEILEI